MARNCEGFLKNQLTRIGACVIGFHCSHVVSGEPSHFKNSLMRLVGLGAVAEAL